MNKRNYGFAHNFAHDRFICLTQTYGNGNTVTGIFRQLFFIALLLTVGSSTLLANETPNLNKARILVPEKIAGVTTMDAEQVIEILSADNPPILIDARIKEDREHGYIENSISLPDIETNCESLKKINREKDKHMLFYCNGIQCGRSVVAIKVARSCGYQNLYWFKGGFAEWKEKGYQYITKR